MDPLPSFRDEDDFEDKDFVAQSAWGAQEWGSVPSRHRTPKRIAAGVMPVGSIGMQVAGLATKHSTYAVGAAVVAGHAVAATGIGLAVAGAALTVGSMALSARSCYKTCRHLDNLQAIERRRNSFRCNVLNSDARFANLHKTIGTIILPYIIEQKKQKVAKKMAGTAGLGLLTAVHAAGRKGYKHLRGTLGKQRSLYAEYLAVHLITANCGLAEAIVAELYSQEEMDQIRGMSSDEAAPLIAAKMKSL